MKKFLYRLAIFPEFVLAILVLVPLALIGMIQNWLSPGEVDPQEKWDEEKRGPFG